MAAYIPTLKESLSSLHIAYKEALAEVPKSIQSIHWQKTKGSFSANPGSAWEEIYYANGCEPHFLVLKAIAEALTSLTAALTLMQQCEKKKGQ